MKVFSPAVTVILPNTYTLKTGGQQATITCPVHTLIQAFEP